MTSSFVFPIPPGYQSLPIWHGGGFIVDGKQVALLEYSENFDGWSDDLTALHENSVGSQHPIDIASREHAIKMVEGFALKGDPVIMEIGCSSGFLLKDLRHTFPDVFIIGVDVTLKPLLRLTKELPSVPLLRFDLLKSPFPSQCIDVLIMLNVLEHIEDDLSALRNAYKLLKSGGVIILEVPAGPSLYDAYDIELRHYRRYNSKELQSVLKSIGFRVVNSTHLGFFTYPPFVLVKLLGKFFHQKNSKHVVETRAGVTSSNALFRWLLQLEQKLLANFSLSFGIRAQLVAVKD